MKINETTMREQYDGQYKTFCKKNSDYGNSFEESLDKHGIVASIVRMGDKMNRLESLTDDSRTQQVGSESLLDTLEDLSNYAAMTACWLKGVRAEDGEEELPDDDNVVEFRATEYILKMLDDINRVVQMKLEKNELLVPMDIYDEAGLIAKCIVQSGTRSESIPIIKDYLFDNSKNIPFEIREWIYGVIMRHLYYINKEHSENEKSSEPKDDDNVVDAMRYSAEEAMNDPIIRKRINEEIISNSLGAIIELMVDDIKRQRDPKVKLDERQIIVDQRQKYYEKITRFILLAPNIEFQDFVNYIRTRSDLHSYEQQVLCEGVAMEIYSQTDKNPGGDDESEFRTKKFNIPTEECKTENLTFKPQKEEKEPLNEKMFKAILWLFHPIIDKDYRGDDND